MILLVLRRWAGERGVELGLALVESVAFTTSRQMKVSHFSFLPQWSSVYPENEGRSEAGRSAVRSYWVATGLTSRPMPSEGIRSPYRYHPLLRLPGQERCSG